MKIYTQHTMRGTQPAIGQITISNQSIFLAAKMIGSLRDIKLKVDVNYDFMMGKLKKQYTDECGRIVTIHKSMASAKKQLTK